HWPEPPRGLLQPDRPLAPGDQCWCRAPVVSDSCRVVGRLALWLSPVQRARRMAITSSPGRTRAALPRPARDPVAGWHAAHFQHRKFFGNQGFVSMKAACQPPLEVGTLAGCPPRGEPQAAGQTRRQGESLPDSGCLSLSPWKGQASSSLTGLAPLSTTRIGRPFCVLRLFV